MDPFDVIVVGAGHAGIEAAHVTASCGLSTLVVCSSLETVGQMSCNPAIGGVAKGHVVREIDALGGVMAHAIDATGIHFKMLNLSKGPAVHSPRAQADRSQYKTWMKSHLERLPNLHLRQGLVEAVLASRGKVEGVGLRTGQLVRANYVILTTGTFMRGVLHVGPAIFPGGRFGELPANEISGSLERLGLKLGRLKTGTPPRVNGSTVHWDAMKPQEPDEPPMAFAHHPRFQPQNEIICYMTHTHAKTHEILARNRDRSPLFSGQISGVGARYCPSVEDKIVKFPDKRTHQVIVEPEGLDTEECYLNGLATSVPSDVQEEMVHSIPGLEKARILRYGYAIEYDYCFPTQLHPWLEARGVQGLFMAGQINGTSGYEEAGAQGLMAAYNVVRRHRTMEPLLLGRHEAYTGVLIDDLVTKGTDEPYRLFTSLAEHRLLLRHDTCDLRLMSYGREMGLIDDETWSAYHARKKAIQQQKDRFESTRLPVSVCQDLLASVGEASSDKSMTLAELLRRPNFHVENLKERDPELKALSRSVLHTLEADIKYAGYIRAEFDRIQRTKALEEEVIPVDFDYTSLDGIRAQAKQKLSQRRPLTVGQASRIPGVSPADLTVLIVALRGRG